MGTLSWRIVSQAASAAIALAMSSSVGAQDRIVPGEAAPAGTWPTVSGPPSRSAFAATRPLRGPVVEAWRVEFDGEIEDGPLVWDQLVLVAERRDHDERFLHVLDLNSGRHLYKARRFRTKVALLPSLWNRRVAVRAREDTVHTYRISRRLLQMVSSTRFEAPVSGPLLFGNELYVRVGDDMVRHDPSRTAPNWRALRVCAGIDAAPSLRGDHVYVVGDPSGEGAVVLQALGRVDGRRAAQVGMPNFALAYHRAQIQIGSGHIALVCTDRRPDLAVPRQLANTALAHRIDARGVIMDEPEAGLVETPFVLGPDSWIGRPSVAPSPSTSARSTWAQSMGDDVISLTDANTHADWLASKAAPSRAGRVAMIGGRAFDVDTRRVLWIAPVELDGLAVPADGFVLGRASANSLVALAPPDRADPESGWTRDGSDAIGGARVITRDGEAVWGTASVEPDTGDVMVGRKRIDSEVVLGVLDADGRPAILPKPQEVPLLVQEAARTAALEACLRLLPIAIQGKDHEGLERALTTARGLGADESDLKAASRALDGLRKRPRRASPKKVELVRTGLRAVDNAAPALLRRLLGNTDPSMPFALHAALLEVALHHDPEMPQAVAAVRALLPEDLRAAEPFDASQWLLFARASRVVDLEVVRPGDEHDSATPREERELARCMRVWREDLFAVRSERLFVVAPLGQPGSVARCVSLGELVCSTLDEMFEGGRVQRDATRRLKVFLYGSSEEYQSLPDVEDDNMRVAPTHLAWTAGHYSPAEGVSRMFLPADDEEFDALHQVFAHELTHHWIDARCPLFTNDEHAIARPGMPGYWIEEGFAELVGNARYDLANRKVHLLDPYDGNLDLVSNAIQARWVSWPDLFAASQVQVLRSLDTRPGSAGEVAQRFRLGVRMKPSQMNLYYAQAGAAAAYLFHAENGRLRDALLRYVGAHHAARPDGVDGLAVEQAFGRSAKDLGRSIGLWAREVAGPAGPKTGGGDRPPR